MIAKQIFIQHQPGREALKIKIRSANFISNLKREKVEELDFDIFVQVLHFLSFHILSWLPKYPGLPLSSPPSCYLSCDMTLICFTADYSSFIMQSRTLQISQASKRRSSWAAATLMWLFIPTDAPLRNPSPSTFTDTSKLS